MQTTGIICYPLYTNFSLVITATDSSNGIVTLPNRRSTSSNVTITVVDVNSHAPIFSSPSGYTTDILEGVGGVGVVSNLALIATDLDCGDTERLRYSIVDGDTSPSTFGIDQISGHLSVIRALDREVTQTLVLTISVSDMHNPPRITTTTVSITVLDINDNPPTFSQISGYAFAVDETQSCGSSSCQQIGVIVASDPDLGLSGSVAYHVTSVHPPSANGTFGLDATSGALVLNTNVCHFRTPNVSLIVNATDQSAPFHSVQTTIFVAITPINVFEPVFGHQGVLTVSVLEQETNVTIHGVNATNADCDGANSLRFSITSTGVPFAIDSVTGVISSTEPLDREVSSFFSLVVVANDGELPVPKTATTQVEIQVLDVNDNAPIFDESSYVHYLGCPITLFFADSLSPRRYAVATTQSTPLGSTIIGVRATDLDFGPLNNLVRYSILSVQNSTDCSAILCGPAVTGVSTPFNIDAVSGLITTRILLSDNIFTSKYDVLVVATDSGSPSLSSNVSVRVTIGAVIDTAPQFNQSVFSVSIAENPPFDDVFITVTASDGSPGSSPIAYSLSPQGNEDGLFTVSAATGRLSTHVAGRNCAQVACIDYETTRSYSLTVIASVTDSVGTVQSSTATVHVSILDMNDHAPVFGRTVYGGSISENINSVIATTVSATDLDEGANAQIAFRIRTPAVPFTINDTTGVITNTRPLDREAIGPPVGDTYTFIVEAYNPFFEVSILNTFVNVTIRVIDVNDEVPQFTQGSMYAIAVPESQTLVTPVMTLNGTDADLSLTANSEIQFALISGNSDGYWQLSSTGRLELVQGLNSTVLPTRIFNLTVEVHDRGVPQLSSRATVLVQVIDPTETLPEFSQNVYSVSVSEDQSAPSSVVTVSATVPVGTLT